jgi:hypothetical protein
MSNGMPPRRRFGAALIAALLVFGGLSGFANAVHLIIDSFRQPEGYGVAAPICSLLVFAWTTRVGWGVWQGQAVFIRWARVLFALQTILFNVGGYAYEFFAGVSVRIMVGGYLVETPPPSHYLTVGGNLGSQFSWDFARHDSRWMVGLNLFALVVLVCLRKTPRVELSEPSCTVGDRDPTVNTLPS